MTQADIPRRVERHGDDLRAIGDTVLDIKETQERHTATLAELRNDVGVLKGDVHEIKGTLREILGLLRQGR